jgi:hypothetical protein
MYVRSENADQHIRRTGERVKDAITKHEQFLSSLKDDSDWAFVIKIHAFLESLITSLVNSHSGEFRLGAIAPRLPMNSSDGICKLELVKANQLLSSEQMRFIRSLGEVRNQLAHDVCMVEAFSFDEYIGRLDSNQKKNWKRDLTYYAVEDPSRHFPEAAITEPRVTIAEALLDLICTIEGSIVLVAMIKEGDDIAKEDTKQLIDSFIATTGAEVETSTNSDDLCSDS